MAFKDFLIKEENSGIGGRIGDVLTSVQDIQSDMDNLGSRQLNRMSEEIVNQIRKILHSRWNPKHTKSLKELQKIAVAIQNTIEKRGDLREVLPAVSQSLETLSGKLGSKVNDMEAPEYIGGEDIDIDDFQTTEPDPGMQQPDPGQPPIDDMQQMTQGQPDFDPGQQVDPGQMGGF